MKLEREMLREIVYGAGRGRYTQDSPVMPDVWFGYGGETDPRLDLLVEPYRGVAPGALAHAIQTALDELGSDGAEHGVAYEERYVAVRLTLGELIRVLLPMTKWWKHYTGKVGGLGEAKIVTAVEKARTAPPESGTYTEKKRPGPTGQGVWFLELAGAIAFARAQPGKGALATAPSDAERASALAPLLSGLAQGRGEAPLAWSINRNRAATTSVWDSRKTIKADAADQIFSLGTSHLTWAILDTGIDALHPAFRQREEDGSLKDASLKNSRVVATYDFTRIRDLISGAVVGDAEIDGNDLRRRLRSGAAIDWELLSEALRIEHGTAKDYRDHHVPGHPHGTHVAGILGGDWRRADDGYEADSENDMLGICPEIRFYDLRVLGADGRGDEFGILAALQFVRWVNSRAQRPMIQGANASVEIGHDVSNYACGRTPVCNEAERLVSSGVMVVAAAGNSGYVQYLTTAGESSAYRNISIADPGNAEAVLTVGATHGRRPHTYGVSYFSSRGPTGDGRSKPDLVAPGEKIKGPIPNEAYDRLDGTSMAAPHVSGAAAMLMSRHPEFIGQPARIKEILCRSATDLGRESYFQGAGLVDACRAIQDV